jgi:tRNA A-37 threonylcarbamoyl transferase component Bud32
MAGDLPADLQSALAPRFVLRQVLGRGGMATVYLAEDHKHQREVALKVLRPDLAASIGSERFLKEIQIAARLTHPHILALHDSGEAGGFLYYVMPYIDGPSLRQRLEREGRLDSVEALVILRPVADALGYAHRMGIFHRDIKPENILFSQGHPIVADFGIAKAISTAGGINLTRTGFPLGTPGYMSPEQAAGLTELDERTDVYSLAVVTYEMLVGEVPGRWPTEEAVRTGRFLEAPAGHRSRLTQVGPVLEAAMVRALAIRLEQRTATPQAFMQELDGAAPLRRRYSEGEIKEIVKRASEMEVSNPTAGGAMTIGGVEALAAEVGIAPEVVRSAAQSVAQRDPSARAIPSLRTNRLIGGPTRILYERVVEGEVADADFPLLVEEIRRVMQNVGQVSQLGRSFTWTGARGQRSQGDMEIAVTVRHGRTRIMVQENLANLIGGVFGGIGGGMGGGGFGIVAAISGSMGIPILIPVLMPLWLATTFAVARTAYHYSSRRRALQLELVADRLAAVAAELVPQRPALRGPEPKRLG